MQTTISSLKLYYPNRFTPLNWNMELLEPHFTLKIDDYLEHKISHKNQKPVRVV